MTNRALIITSGAYADSALTPLQAAIRDGQRFSAALATHTGDPFHTTVVEDPALRQAQVTVQQFLAEAKPDDLNILHFSGHGVRDHAGRFFYALPDTDPDLLAATALSGTFLRDQILDTRARRNIVILDTCYAGAFGRNLIAKGNQPPNGVPRELAEELTSELNGGTGLAILAAASPIQLAFESAEARPQSFFTRFICDGIESGLADSDGDGWITLNDLFTYTQLRLREEVIAQTPELSAFSLSGDLKVLRVNISRKKLEMDVDITTAIDSVHHELRMAAVVVVAKYAGSHNERRRSAARRYLRVLRNDADDSIRRTAEEALHTSRRSRRAQASALRQGVPRVRAEQASATVVVPNRALRSMAASVPDYVDNLFYGVLENVRVRIQNGNIDFTSTDRFQLDHWSLNCRTTGVVNSIELSIPVADIAALRRLPAFEDTRIDVFDYDLEFSTTDKFLTVHGRKDAEYPRVENLLDVQGIEFEVSRVDMIDAVERTLASTLNINGTAVAIEVSEQRAEMRISTDTEQTRAAQASLPVADPTGPMNAAFTPAFLLAALTSIASTTVHIVMSKDPQTLAMRESALNGNATHTHLLMARNLTTRPMQ